MDSENYYQAMRSKDRRFDGRVFFGVVTTGIYCRPICPARIPLKKNVKYYRTAAEAEEAGFRPCLRCRPETSPGSPVWIGTSATVTRALRLIHSGYLKEKGLEDLASSLGVGERHLRRLFVDHLGASPLRVIQVRRLDFARKLVDQTSLPISDIAFASGFESLRRFNDDFKQRFRRSPSQARKKRGSDSNQEGLSVTLAYRPPYDVKSLLGFFAGRAIPGVEWADEVSYSRSVAFSNSRGWIRVTPEPEKNLVRLTLAPSLGEHLMEVVDRVTGMFDLNADPMTIQSALKRNTSPGLRVPGAWDPFELSVRAILGQQISVTGARTLAKRLAEKFGEPMTRELSGGIKFFFPTPAVLRRAELKGIGVTTSRAETLRRLAEMVDNGSLSLSPHADLEKTKETLRTIPGIGPWTVEYISLRALRDPDAFPTTDLVLKRALQRQGLKQAPAAWSPWRAYAALNLWRMESRREK